jgi:broad specificity phosphatase PhoE
MKSINLFFVRHGFAQHNELPSDTNRTPSKIDDPHLTDLGIKQARELSGKLTDIKFHGIFCSPLSRCIQTTDILVNDQTIYLNDLLLEYSKDIEELSNKRKSKEEIIDYTRFLENNTYDLSFVENDYHYSVETEEVLVDRITFFLNYIFENFYETESNILIITHYNWLRYCFFEYCNTKSILPKHCELYFMKLEKVGDKIKLFYNTNNITYNKDENEQFNDLFRRIINDNNSGIIGDKVDLFMNRKEYNNLISEYKLINRQSNQLYLLKNQRKITLFDPLEYKNKVTIYINVFKKSYNMPELRTGVLSDNIISVISKKFPVCNYVLFDMLLSYIDKNYDNINTKIYKDKFRRDDFCALFYYFYYIKKYINQGYIIFSLGSSLEKFNSLWNNKNKNKINIIPFSGNVIYHPNDFKMESGRPTFFNRHIDPIPNIYIKPKEDDIDWIPIESNLIKYLNNDTKLFTILEGEYVEIDGSIINLSIDNDKYEMLLSQYDNLISNNITFKKLITDLNNNKRVLITDVMSRGKSLYTLLLLLEEKNINYDNLSFLYITEYHTSPQEIEIIKNSIRYNFKVFNIRFNFLNIDFIPDITLFRDYHQNSEISKSRCIPKYETKLWDEELPDVFIDDYNPNYLLCNIHKLLYNLSNTCFYDKFILPKLNNGTNPDNIVIIKEEIKEFIITNRYDNVLDGLDINQKYLKYKQKYLKLKQNL